MRGHIRKRGSAYAVVVDIGRDPLTQKRRQKWHSGYRTRKQAEQALTEILSRLNQGTYVLPTKETLSEFLDAWLKGTRSRVRESTWESYSRNVRVHVKPQLGSAPLQQVTPADLNAFYARLLKSGRRDGKGLSPRTVRYIHTILRKALSDAVRWNKLTRNPADSADPPRPSASRATRPIQTWSADQLRAFLEHVRDDRLYPLWLLAATTGMRRGELLGLHWSDIDLDNGRVTVQRSLGSVAYRLTWSEPKTAKSRRQIALDPTTTEALRRHQQDMGLERQLLGITTPDPDVVFCEQDAQPLHPERVSKLFEQHTEDAALNRIRLHDLRHTHATLALQAGVHPKIVSERLGHSDIALTLNVYSHAIPALEETAASLVASLVLDS